MDKKILQKWKQEYELRKGKLSLREEKLAEFVFEQTALQIFNELEKTGVLFMGRGYKESDEAYLALKERFSPKKSLHAKEGSD